MAEKTYPVSRNGIQFEVRAKSKDDAARIAETVDLATVPRVIARKGKTRVLERANGQRYLVSPEYSTTDQEKIGKFLDGVGTGEMYSQAIDEEAIARNPIAARAQEFIRGVPFAGSYADEAVGLVSPQAAQGMRQLSGAMQRQRPGQTAALNVAGGLTGAGVAAAAAPAAVARGASAVIGQGPRMAQIGRAALAGGTAGGIEGGIYGLGEGIDAESRMQAAGSGAGIGASFGAGLGAAGPVVAAGARNIAGIFKRSDIGQIAKTFGISASAAKVIKNTFDQGGEIDAAIQNLQRAGNEGMIADAGPAAQALLDATGASGGRAGQVVRGAVDQRMSRTSTNVENALTETLGASPIGPRAAIDDIAQRTAPQRQAAYDAAFNSPINYASDTGRKIEEELSRIEPSVLSEAISEANAVMLDKGMTNQQIMATIGENGKVVYKEMPNVMQLNEIKKALQGIAYDNTDDFGRLTQRGQRYSNQASRIRDAVSEAVPEYGAAVSMGGDKLAEERAFVLGSRLLQSRTNIEDVMRELGDKPSAAQVEAAKSGLRSYIDKALGDVRAIASDPGADALEARQVVKAVTDMSSSNARKKIRELLGAEADALLSQIDQAAQSATVRAAMAQNSKTAPRIAIRETVDELTAPGVVDEAMRGELVNTTKGLVQAVTGQTAEYTAAQRQRIYEDIALALTERRGDDALMALRSLDAAMKGQAITDRQTDELAKLIATVLYSGTTSGVSGAAAAEQRQNQ